LANEVVKGKMSKLTPEIKSFIDEEVRSNKALKYADLRQKIDKKYGVLVSSSTISKRIGKELNISLHRGRRRVLPPGIKPARSIFLDCAGAFFLKGIELEIGLLETINQMLKTGVDSAQAHSALMLARQINALLLYSPIFGLKSAGEISKYRRKGLLYLTGQHTVPKQEEIEQYLRFLGEERLLLPIIKEVARSCSEGLFTRIDFAGQTFYLDAQTHTVWPNTKIPQCFSSTINKASSYVKDIFLSPSPQSPLILQACPGYTFLPQEMCSLMHCFEEAENEVISRIIIGSKSEESLRVWQDVKPGQKCYFIAPLSPWQYAKIQGSQIIQDFQEYIIGPEKEPMSIADAMISLPDTQRNETIEVRAALVRRKDERIALITNISSREERYIRKIAEHYFCRWPNKRVKSYYDILEEAHQEDQEILKRSPKPSFATPILTMSYDKDIQNGFKLLLEQLNRAAATRFFPSDYAGEDLEAMRAKFYQQSGYLKIRQHGWDVILRKFPQKDLQEAALAACENFNQSGIKFPSQKGLYIYIQ
jgi:hypothetical protein